LIEAGDYFLFLELVDYKSFREPLYLNAIENELYQKNEKNKKTKSKKM